MRPSPICKQRFDNYKFKFMESNNKNGARKLVLFMHTSLDGFTARPDGAMDWIHIDDDMFEYARIRTEQSDTALYGRKTFELMDAYWPAAAEQPNASKHDKEHSSWYNQVEKIVVSKTLEQKKIPKIKILNEQIPERIKELKKKPGGEIIMFGSPALAAYLTDHNLIDEYWLLVNPVILGKGIPLFREMNKQINLKLLESRVFKGGVVCSYYQLAG